MIMIITAHCIYKEIELNLLLWIKQKEEERELHIKPK